MLEGPDLPLVELANEQLFLAVDVCPTGGSVARAFHANGGIARFQAYRRLEVRSAAKGSAGSEHESREQESLHEQFSAGQGVLNQPSTSIYGADTNDCNWDPRSGSARRDVKILACKIPGVRLGHNLTAFRGGIRPWNIEQVPTLSSEGESDKKP